MKGREESRKLLAEALRVTPEEIVITRNTSEGNNFVSSGLDLHAGDEVVVWADNHPSNLNAWRIKVSAVWVHRRDRAARHVRIRARKGTSISSSRRSRRARSSSRSRT